VDAAWGGYLATLFRRADGSLRPREEVARGFAQFPSAGVHAAAAALAATDSITIDPHKLGYLPYGAGAFVCRDHRAMALLAESADYVFHDQASRGYRARYRNLGQFIPEGSKAGANVAAVFVTHKVLPLDHANFGCLPARTVRSAEAFHQAAIAFATRLQARVAVRVPFPPDSNLVCVAFNPVGNRDIGRANAFVRRLHDELRVDPATPLQDRSFFGSVTTLRPQALGAAGMQRILDALGLDAAGDGDGEDHLVILRHTLMNPWLIDERNGISYIDMYFQYLEKRIGALLDAA
jgi:glutamate/tyrosine decarboxylase-like PLP-dependent enzyme